MQHQRTILSAVVLVASAVNIRYHGRLYMGGVMLSLLALLLFSFSRWYSLSLPTLLVYGLGAGVFTTMQPTVVMLLSTEEMRGKALGIISLAIGTGLLGHPFVGTVADAAGISFAIGLNATIGLTCLVLIGLFMPSLRQRILPEEQS